MTKEEKIAWEQNQLEGMRNHSQKLRNEIERATLAHERLLQVLNSQLAGSIKSQERSIRIIEELTKIIDEDEL